MFWHALQVEPRRRVLLKYPDSSRTRFDTSHEPPTDGCRPTVTGAVDQEGSDCGRPAGRLTLVCSPVSTAAAKVRPAAPGPDSTLSAGTAGCRSADHPCSVIASAGGRCGPSKVGGYGPLLCLLPMACRSLNRIDRVKWPP